MGLKLANNAISTLSGSISSSDTSISVLPGEGSRFPAITGSDWFPLTLIKASGEYEIVKATGRSSDAITITRAQETTTALSFSAGDRVELRFTAGAYDTLDSEKLDTAGGDITGSLTIGLDLEVGNDLDVTGDVTAATMQVPSGGSIKRGTHDVWDEGTFDPTTKMDKAGGTFTGPITVQGASAGVIVEDRAGLATAGKWESYSTSSALKLNYNKGTSGPGSTGDKFTFNYDGKLTCVDVTITSDSRHKTDLVPITNALEQVAQLTGYLYTLKDTGQRHIGLIAQEVRKVRPEAVDEDVDGYLSLRYGNLVALAFAAINELAEQVRAMNREA